MATDRHIVKVHASKEVPCNYVAETLHHNTSVLRLTSLIKQKKLHEPSNFMQKILTLNGNIKV